MEKLTYREAVIAAISQEMTRDKNVLLIGEDIAAAGGVFKTTVGKLSSLMMYTSMNTKHNTIQGG